MADFDPDAYLAATSPSPAPATSPAFDPDQYIAATAPQSAVQATPSDSGFTFAPKSGTQMDVDEGRQLAEIPAVQNAVQAAGDVLKGTLQGAVQLPEQMYKVARAGFDQGPIGTVTELANQAIPMGTQIARDVQSPLGSRESFRGMAQLGMMAAPLLGDILFPKPEAIGAPPVQQAPTLTQTLGVEEPNPLVQATNDALDQLEPKYAPAPPQTAPVPEEPQVAQANIEAAPVTQEPAGFPESQQQFPSLLQSAEESRRAPEQVPQVREALSLDELRLMRERNELQFQNDIAQKVTGVTHPAVDERLGQIDDELNNIANRELQQKGGGEVNASEIASTEGVPGDTLREPVGEEAPLQQQGETSQARQGTEARPETAQTEVAQPAQEQVAQPTEPVSTKNEYTEAQRSARELPEAEQAAKRGFGKVWDEAAAQAQQDPTIGRRLVSEINENPRPISDVENAHLLRREIEAQKEHSDAVDAVNSAQTDSDLTAAKARLESARNDLQDVYNATKSAGTKGGQALAARQMLAKEDYSLAKMEARRRAANDGQPLNENQLAETQALHDQISDLQSKLDAHELAARFNNEFNKLVEQSRKDARASKSSGTKFTDFMDRKANEARSRIAERRGRLTTGFDPTAITDEAVIGASHIAKGLTNFADWSAKMVQELGDQIRPFLKDIWDRSKSFHDANAKEYGDKALARYKTYLGKQTEQIKAKLEAGDFTKAQRQKTQLDKEAFNMRADLQKLKNQFERGVAKEAYQNKSPAQKFWDHFVGVERAMKLSGPEVFGKLGTAAAVREALAPIESGVGYGVSKALPALAKGTKYQADFGTLVRGELKAKAALFTDGMKDAWQNVKGQETGLDAIGKSKTRPDFWYNRIGNMHAAIKAPVKRAEFTRDLEQRMAVAIKNGEDINHPEVMTRLANESVMESNRAIFQNKTVVSSFFSMLERQSPTAGRVARFLFPVVKIPVNLFKELVNLHVGAPVGAARVGMAYWKGVETLPAVQREAIIRQLTKGSIGGAGLLWGYYNSDKVRNFFDHAPVWFQHTPMAMILNEGSYLKGIQAGGKQATQSKKELAYMAKTDIPFMYTIKDIGDALDTHNSHALLGWINNMTQSTVVPQISTQVAKQMDKPGTFPSNIGERPTYRPATNPVEAVKLGIPGLRQTVPEKQPKTTGASRLRRRR